EGAQQAYHVARHVGDADVLRRLARCAMPAQVDGDGRKARAELGDLIQPRAVVAAEPVDEDHGRRPGLPRFRMVRQLIVDVDVSCPHAGHSRAPPNARSEHTPSSTASVAAGKAYWSLVSGPGFLVPGFWS